MIDALIIAMLVGSFGYNYLLSRKIERLRKALVEVGPALQSFAKAVDRSEKTVEGMKEVSDEIVRENSGLTQKVSRRSREPKAPAGKSDMITNFFQRNSRGNA